jgi:hypothetical protein
MTSKPRLASDFAAWPRRASIVLTTLGCLALGACSTWRIPFTSAQKVPVESRLGFTPAPAKAASAPAVATAPVAAPSRSTRATSSTRTPATPTWSEDVRWTTSWITQTHDNAGQPFAILDKKNARLYVFRPDGSLRASSPVLLGLAKGDHSVPGIGTRPMAEIRPDERTTPAGRFVIEPGRNSHGEDILWVDYDAAVSMHRVRPVNPAERRLQRLASATAADNRISFGCINVPVAFYNKILSPTFNKHTGIVYVLPETMPARDAFVSPSRGAVVARAVPVVHRPASQRED